MAFIDWAAYYRERVARMERDRAARREEVRSPTPLAREWATRPTPLVRWHEGKKRP